jgi:hypothetical protein
MTSCPSVGQSSICATTDFCGQDAQYGWDASHPATARFARAGDWEPTVTDNVTGLMWQGCVPGLNGAACATGTALKHLYADGHDYCANSDWGGFNDWRLPDRFEIESIANYAGGDNAVRTDVFPALSGGLVSFLTLSMNSDGTRTCVTLTSGAEGCGSFCVVNHSAVSSVACGGIYANGVGAAYALCVRGALTPGSAARFSRTTGWEPVVSDADNGLMWQGCSAGQNGDNCENGAATTRNWHDALQYCEVLSWAGHDDWRLPNAIELLSISDGAFKSGAIDVQYFPKTDAGGAFCSSTPYGVGATVWIAEYGSGSVGPADKGSSFEVRCVRMLP